GVGSCGSLRSSTFLSRLSSAPAPPGHRHVGGRQNAGRQRSLRLLPPVRASAPDVWGKVRSAFAILMRHSTRMTGPAAWRLKTTIRRTNLVLLTSAPHTQGTLMKITRRFTEAGRSPYASIPFRRATSEIKNPDGSVVFSLKGFDVPEQ